MGELVANRYELIEKIGEGGIAVVYKAWDTATNQIVAVKFLREQYLSDPIFVARFQNEANQVKQITHPNIVQVYDSGYTDSGGIHTYYIAMEYVDGPNLKEYIWQQGHVQPEEVLSIALQMLQGLGAAHAQGIVHRDIKPQNILLAKDGRVLVTDFGIAKGTMTPALTEHGMTIGTAEYIAPEQAQGHDVGPPADLYGLGIVLYEMLTGVLPFTGTSALDVAMKQVAQLPQPPSEINPAIPTDLERIVMRALEKNPDRRYQTVDEMIAALEQVNPALAPAFMEEIPGTPIESLYLPVSQSKPSQRIAGILSGLPAALMLHNSRVRAGVAGLVTVVLLGICVAAFSTPSTPPQQPEAIASGEEQPPLANPTSTPVAPLAPPVTPTPRRQILPQITVYASGGTPVPATATPTRISAPLQQPAVAPASAPAAESPDKTKPNKENNQKDKQQPNDKGSNGSKQKEPKQDHSQHNNKH